ncbi:MAG TPA: EF-Tu/IF-2/RF-3 family GTPase [Patescibacteria group bacterium]|nr:EF-Tu/IF-2/RF-3 family GTPase [Patescibacteria group bacterium]
MGEITHYYDKIGVAVVKLVSGDLKVGDKVKLTDSQGEEFEQEIKSMQIEHAKIEIAKKGDEFGLKVDKSVKDKSAVVKV